MVNRVTIKVEGLSELGERMRQLSSATAVKFSARATGKAAGLVKAFAKRNVRTGHVRTGTLDKHIITKKLRNTELTSVHIVTVKKEIYPRHATEKVTTRKSGSLLEFGSVSQSPKPWLRPALDENVEKAIDAMKRSLASDITKAGK